MATAPAPAFPEAAYNNLVAKVYAPIFFEKLANDYGIVPQSVEEQRSLLDAANILRAEADAGQTKQAGAASFIVEGIDGLKQVMHEQGRGGSSPTSNDRLVKEAAARVVRDNAEVAKASLEYYEYLSKLQPVAR